MNEQGAAVDQTPFQPVESAGAPSAMGFDPMPGSVLSPPEPGQGPVSPEAPSDPAPSASLVGSLSVFSLVDVLSLLASTAQTGEVQVESETVDGRLWLDNGQLSNAQVGVATTIGQAVFELACLLDGWFYFTAGVVSSSGQPPVPVEAVLAEVGPQVGEWREIRGVVPLDSVVNLSPTPPGQDVQIRSDQWKVLTTVGNSDLTVNAVLDTIGGDQIVGLRTLRDLLLAGLIVINPTLDGPGRSGASPSYADLPSDTSEITTLPLPSSDDASGQTQPDDNGVVPPPPPLGSDPAVAGREGRFGSLAQVAIMPPPIADDPWAPVTQSSGSAENGSA